MSLDRLQNLVPKLTGDDKKDLENIRAALFRILRASARQAGLFTTLTVQGDATFRDDVTITDDLLVGDAATITGLLTLIAGQIAFPATQNPSANANTLDDYEEGTWTPGDGSGAGLTLVGPVGTYVKVGRFVWASGALTYPATANGAQATISGLPFAAAAGNENRTGVLSYTTAATPAKFLLDGGAASGSFFAAAGGGQTNAQLSGSFNAINAGYSV